MKDDQLPRKPIIPSYCGKWQWVNLNTGEFRPYYCGGRKCEREICKKKFWRTRITLISDLIKEYNLDKFFTLTVDRTKFDSLFESWGIIAGIWNKTRTSIVRDYPGFLYVAVLEAHRQEPWPHLHGFTNSYLHQREWSSRWSANGGGSIVWVERVDTANIADYVSKELEVARYVGKDNLCEARLLVGHRRRTLWRSRIKTERERQDDVQSEWKLIKEK